MTLPLVLPGLARQHGAGLAGGQHRADRHPAAGADRHVDAGHRVLVARVRGRVRRRRAVRPRADRCCRCRRPGCSAGPPSPSDPTEARRDRAAGHRADQVLRRPRRSSTASTSTCRAGSPRCSGASGCGKTTLLRLVAGFLEPDAGTIRLGDRVVAGDGRPVPPRAAADRLRAPGGRAVPAPRRGREHRLRARPGATYRRRPARRVEEMLDLVELPRPWRRPGRRTSCPAASSSGWRWPGRWRPEPDVVLLDEPFSSLDAGLREETGRAVARALRASEATAVLVTHDQGEALSLADQVAVMADGRFLQVATPNEVYLDPASPDVAAFVGHAALVPGHRLRTAPRPARSARCRCVAPATAGAARGPARAGGGHRQGRGGQPDGRGARGVVLRPRRDGPRPGRRAATSWSRSPRASRRPACRSPGSEIGVRVVGEVLAFPESPGAVA